MHNNLEWISMKHLHLLLICMETIRAFSVLVAKMEFQVFQLDVKSAFLNGDLEEVYVEQLKEYMKIGKEDKVY